MAILPDNEFYTFENRQYVNPQVSLDEQNAFIDNLRSTQQLNNNEIANQTYNLGSALPASMGGLTGSGSYFASRYQTPQTSALTANLRTAAQAQALNEIMANAEAMWKKRYNDAYRQYQQRSYKNSGNNNNSDGGNKSTWDGESTLTPSGDDKNKSTTPPNPEDFWVDATTQQQTGAVNPSQMFNIMNPLHWIGLM